MTTSDVRTSAAVNDARSLVSVCIPVYNGAAYLADCLDSVVAQTYANLEILVVDDCSTDDSASIVLEYQRRDPRIVYVKNERNLGLVGNWNYCVDLARGDWLKYVFQDDLLLPTCLEEMMKYAHDPAALITCKRDFIFDGTVSDDLKAAYARNQRRVDYFFDGSDFASAAECQRIAIDRFSYNVFGEPTSVLLHKSFFSRFGRFREGLIMICDLEYWIRVAIHTGAYYVAQPLVRFRVHGDATTAKNHRLREFRTSTLDGLLLLSYFAQGAVYEPLRQHALARQLPVDLEDNLAKNLHRTYAMADWQRRDRVSPNLNPMRELDAFYKEFPSLRRSAVAHWLWRLKAAWQAKRAAHRTASART